VPWGAQVIRSLRDLDDHDVAELVRKKTGACATAIVFGDEEAQQGIAPAVVDADGNRVEQFEPGLIAYAVAPEGRHFPARLRRDAARTSASTSPRPPAAASPPATRPSGAPRSADLGRTNR
jgi:hypothetical protein